MRKKFFFFCKWRECINILHRFFLLNTFKNFQWASQFYSLTPTSPPCNCTLKINYSHNLLHYTVASCVAESNKKTKKKCKKKTEFLRTFWANIMLQYTHIQTEWRTYSNRKNFTIFYKTKQKKKKNERRKIAYSLPLCVIVTLSPIQMCNILRRMQTKKKVTVMQ